MTSAMYAYLNTFLIPGCGSALNPSMAAFYSPIRQKGLVRHWNNGKHYSHSKLLRVETHSLSTVYASRTVSLVVYHQRIQRLIMGNSHHKWSWNWLCLFGSLVSLVTNCNTLWFDVAACNDFVQVDVA